MILFLEYQHITKDFLEDQKIKNQHIKKATYTFLDSLKYDTSKKVDFIIENKKVTEAFAAQDRKKLYALIQKYYNRQVSLNKYLKIMTFRLKDGSTFLRVHKPAMYGDKLNKKRKIIVETNQYLTVNTGFEVGKLKMTYRIVKPIFHNNEHVGLIEVGIEPEYIIEKLKSSYNLEYALFVEKSNLSVHMEKIKNIKYKENFAMVRGSDFFYENFNDISVSKDVEGFIKHKDSKYMLENTLNLYDHRGNIAAKLLFASKVLNFERRDQALIFNVVFISFMMLTFYILLNYIINLFMKEQNNYINTIEKQSRELNAVLNGAGNIIVLTNGENILKANEAFFNFFEKYDNIDEFKKEYNCICDRFEKTDLEDYINGKMIESLLWTEYILQNPNKSHKVIIKKETRDHHFIIAVKEIQYENTTLDVIDLSDITTEVEQKDMIQQQSKMLIDQTKMAALGEMIRNIAHQWRQPLSTISTNASGLELKEEMGHLSKEEMKKSLESIIRNTKYLSDTLDNFKSFIKDDKRIKECSSKNIIDRLINLVEANMNHHKIAVELKIEDIKFKTYENELIQALHNIITNCSDILISKDQERTIFIEVSKKDKELLISIKDNGGGIDSKIINKIFEPYFTTKHQSQEAGLGLFLTHKIIKDRIKGDIRVKNHSFKINGKEFIGAHFIINIPL